MSQPLAPAACEPACTALLAGEVRAASAWLDAQADRLQLPPRALQRLDLCLHEALANVADHADPRAAQAPVWLQLECLPGHSVTLQLRDEGAAFDPTQGQTVLPTSLEQASPGGLGLLMLRRLSDRLEYQREQDGNVLRLTVLLSHA